MAFGIGAQLGYKHWNAEAQPPSPSQSGAVAHSSFQILSIYPPLHVAVITGLIILHDAIATTWQGTVVGAAIIVDTGVGDLVVHHERETCV